MDMCICVLQHHNHHGDDVFVHILPLYLRVIDVRDSDIDERVAPDRG